MSTKDGKSGDFKIKDDFDSLVQSYENQVDYMWDRACSIHNDIERFIRESHELVRMKNHKEATNCVERAIESKKTLHIFGAALGMPRDNSLEDLDELVLGYGEEAYKRINDLRSSQRDIAVYSKNYDQEKLGDAVYKFGFNTSLIGISQKLANDKVGEIVSNPKKYL
ncbi:hypothetical protein ACFLZZ_02310 [Nanoarchaeota archaeon]